MKIEKRFITDLRPAEYNPRLDLKPGDDEYKKIKRSIERFGYVDPIIFNEKTGNIVGGHQRAKVLLDLGIEEVDVVIIDIDEIEEKALNVALNKISGDWDNDKLITLLNELDELDFDIELTGFDTGEFMEFSFEEIGEKEKEPKDNPPTMKVVFENEQDFRNMEKDLRELIETKYSRVRVSILGGEL